jgi:hypothetical protein
MFHRGATPYIAMRLGSMCIALVPTAAHTAPLMLFDVNRERIIHSNNRTAIAVDARALTAHAARDYDELGHVSVRLSFGYGTRAAARARAGDATYGLISLRSGVFIHTAIDLPDIAINLCDIVGAARSVARAFCARTRGRFDARLSVH